MKCPKCGADSSVLATRGTLSGYVLKRSRTCFNRHRFSTFEVDDSLKGVITKYAMTAEREAKFKKHMALWARNERIVRRVEAGEKHAVVAAEFGLSDNMVSTIVRRSRGLGPNGPSILNEIKMP